MTYVSAIEWSFIIMAVIIAIVAFVIITSDMD
jgi:hypothetical protein